MGIRLLYVQHLHRQSKLQWPSNTLQDVSSDSVGKWGASAAPPVAASDPGMNLSGKEIYQAASQMLLPWHLSSVFGAGDPVVDPMLEPCHDPILRLSPDGMTHGHARSAAAKVE